MTIDPEWLDIVACPKCKGELKVLPEPEGFACEACQLFYEVVDDIPNFLIDDAKPLASVTQGS